MDEARMALVVEAEGLHDEPDISKHLELAARVLAEALTGQATTATANNLANVQAAAKGEIAKAKRDLIGRSSERGCGCRLRPSRGNDSSRRRSDVGRRERRR